MKKSIQKRRLALLLAGALVLAQLPTNYADATESSAVQESTEITSNNDEADQAVVENSQEADVTDEEVIAEEESESETTEEEVTVSEENESEAVTDVDDSISLSEDKSGPAVENNWVDTWVATTTGTVDEDGFEINNGVLIAYTGEKTDITIPSTVTSIKENAFNENDELKSVIIPNTVTSIGGSAFEDCWKLESVTIQSGVTDMSIGEQAFLGCYSLTNINIPSGVTSIGYSAFESTSLTNITIPGTLKNIEDYVFAECSSLTEVTIQNGVTSIGYSAFESSGLTNITIPSSVTSIGDGAFAFCSSLTKITIPNGVTSIGADAFEHCFRLTSIVLPNSLKSIGGGAFSYCEGLKSITIPDSVTSIGMNAFFRCNDQGVNRYTTSQAAVIFDSYFTIYCNPNSYAYTYAQSYKKSGIIAVTPDGKSTNDTIEVKSIKLNKAKYTLAKKGTLQLNATVSPENATNTAVTWTSSNTKVATVSAKGKVTAVAAGSATISATAQDGSKVTATCKITVPKATSYKITYKLNKGTNAVTNPTYYATGTKVSLAKPTRKNYTFSGWYIGDTKVSSISKTTKGKITLIAKWDKVSVDKTTVKSAKNSKAGTVTVAFDKVSGVKGYTVYYSTDKKLKNATVMNLSSGKKSATIKGLEKGKTYYVTVKAYKVDSQGNKVYGKANKTISVKVKK